MSKQQIESLKENSHYETIYLTDGKYINQNWKSIFTRAEKCSLENLSLINNFYIPILKDIYTVHFTSLVGLWVGGNNIMSLEPLYMAQMGKLEILGFGKNYFYRGNNSVTSFKASMVLPSIRHLSFSILFLI